jgi:hypothetical protein
VKTTAVHDGNKELPAHLIVTIGGQGQVLKQDVQNLEINMNGLKKDQAYTAGTVSKEGIYEVVVTGRTSVPESTFDIEIRASGLMASPMVMGAMGSAQVAAMDRLRDGDDPVKAVASPWIEVVPVPIEDAGGSEVKPELGMGSTLFVPVKLSGAVRASASGEQESTQLNAQLLDSSGKPLVEKVDYTLDEFGFMNFPKERDLLIAVHALRMEKGSDSVEVKLIKRVGEIPVVRVSAKDPKTGAYTASVSSGGAFSEQAVTMVYWFDGYLGDAAPTAVSLVGNLPISEGSDLGLQKLGLKPAELLKIFAPNLTIHP